MPRTKKNVRIKSELTLGKINELIKRSKMCYLPGYRGCGYLNLKTKEIYIKMPSGKIVVQQKTRRKLV